MFSKCYWIKSGKPVKATPLEGVNCFVEGVHPGLSQSGTTQCVLVYADPIGVLYMQPIGTNVLIHSTDIRIEHVSVARTRPGEG